MKPQIISRDGQPEYAVLPWEQYLKLLEAAQGSQQVVAPQAEVAVPTPALADIKRMREAQGLRIEQLARAVGVSPHYMNMIESGEREPDAAIQRALAWNLSAQRAESDS